eukprot:TRINITY_DN6289_c0_g3_i1.p1 TRINITY_DN6289_c0_g3~~TRINITY_DN6289_c0_g3_i1.p1  ORF type:complete len:258 (-),score=-14.17 TRINITY_DN6289_c0_g3_i1:364-1137(-)
MIQVIILFSSINSCLVDFYVIKLLFCIVLLSSVLKNFALRQMYYFGANLIFILIGSGSGNLCLFYLNIVKSHLLQRNQGDQTKMLCQQKKSFDCIHFANKLGPWDFFLKFLTCQRQFVITYFFMLGLHCYNVQQTQNLYVCYSLGRILFQVHTNLLQNQYRKIFGTTKLQIQKEFHVCKNGVIIRTNFDIQKRSRIFVPTEPSKQITSILYKVKFWCVLWFIQKSISVQFSGLSIFLSFPVWHQIIGMQTDDPLVYL